jgi:uncharacterized protein
MIPKKLFLGVVALSFHCAIPAQAAGTAEVESVGGVAYSVAVMSMKEMRLRAAFRSTVRQQEDFSCGSAAIATLLTFHYQQPVTEREVLEAMYIKGDQAKIRREGFSLLDMKLYLENRGYHADGFKVSLDKLIETKTPAIALVRDNGFNHFVVIKGIQGDKMLIGDPALGTRLLPRQEFEAKWLNGLVFVIHNRPDIAQFNVAEQWSLIPSFPLAEALARDSLATINLSRFGPNDF